MTQKADQNKTLSDQFSSTQRHEQMNKVADQTLSLRVLPGTLIYPVLFITNVLANSYHQVHPGLVSTAGILLLTLCLFRASVFIWFQQIHNFNNMLWRVLFVVGTLGVAAVWSFTWSVAIFLDGLILTTNLSMMMTIGITCAGVATLAPNRFLVIAYLLLMFIPAPTAVVLHGAEGRFTIMFLFAIGIPFLISVGNRLNQEFWQGLQSKALLEQRAKELAVARDAALAVDRAKSEFLARMSHEIRTPMNGVMGMAELLLNSDLNERQYHFTRSINRSAEALLNVINDILDFSKIEAGKLTLENHNFNLHVLLEEQVEMFAESAHRKGIELTCLIPPDLVSEVIGDKNRLCQILTNLLGNALKFTEQGEVSVRVCQEKISGNVNLYRFEVEDTGVGIPSEATKHIFDSFSQADNSTTRKYHGTGLGLTICKQLCELMGGEIGVESHSGAGTTFWFTVQLEDQPNTLERKSEPVYQTCFRRVVALDASKNSRLVIENMLKIFKLDLTFVNNEKELLVVLQQGVEGGIPFDMVIVNSGFANKPPLDMVGLIHACTTSSSPVKVLILSPVTTDDEIDQQHSSSGFVSLRKPLRRKAFYNFLADKSTDSAPTVPKSKFSSTNEQENAGKTSPPVLLVEDNVVNQDVATIMIESLGYPVEIAENGLQGFQMASTRKYIMILMDCQMPEMDGYQATIKIREWERQSDADRLPIIAVTANAMQGDREKALAAGMDDYLDKPFKMEELQKMMQLWGAFRDTCKK